jgi:hypothetical protein
MSHDDGRCAKDEETIYVQATGTCASVVGAANGTEAVPYCSMDTAGAALGMMPAKALVVVRGNVNGTSLSLAGRKISIVGQMNASLTGGPIALRLSAGDLYVRRVTISAGMFSMGVQAEAGSILRLDHVVVTGNKGGIALRSANFDIQNTTVVNNESVDEPDGTTSWGGIYVQNPPAVGSTEFRFLTVQNNKAPGIFCTGAVDGMGVLASGNTFRQVTPSCGFTFCDAASATCGVQP